MTSTPTPAPKPHLEKIRKLLADRSTPKATNSISDYLNLIRSISQRWQEADWMSAESDDEQLLNNVRIVGQVWFRGHSKRTHKLKPGLYRESTYRNLAKQKGSPVPYDKRSCRFEELIELEHELRIDFTSYGRLLNPANEAKSSSDWYFLMQHHGVPTRLLDWTTNALAALFFCVRDHQTTRVASDTDSKSKAKVAVWMLDAYWLADRLSEVWSAPLLAWSSDADRYIPPLEVFIEKMEDSKVLIPKHAMPIEPPALHPRVAAQEGRFIIFGQTEDLLDERIRLEPLATGKGFEELRIQQIWFDVEDIDILLHDLAQLGVSRRTLFPDLAGLADFVTWKHLHRIRGYKL
jgi:hypothetical protein